MAFSGRTVIGPIQAINSAAAGITITPTATIPVGVLAVVYIGIDNGGTAAGDSTEITVTDPQLNTWIRAKEQTQGGSANASSTVAIFYSVITTALTNADPILASFSSRSARTMAGEYFSMGAGSTITVVDPIGQGGTGTPATITHSAAVASQEYVAAVATAVESNTTTGGWSTFQGSATNVTTLAGTSSGGGSAANQALRVGSVIRSPSITNPAWAWSGVLSGDHRTVAVLFKENPVTGTTVAPGTGVLTATGFAPTVFATNPQTVAPALGQLTANGFAPTVIVNTIVAAGVGALLATGFAPTIQNAGKVVAPAVGVATVTGFAPTVTPSQNITVNPNTGAVTVTGFAPTVFASNLQSVSPGLGQLTATGFSPTLSVSDNKTVSPSVGTLTATGYAPTVTASGGSGAFALVAHTIKAPGANGGSTDAIDTTGADLIVAVVSSYAGATFPGTFTDSKANTWNARTTQSNGGSSRVQIFDCKPTSVGSGHTFDYSATNAFCVISVSAWSGSATSPFDVENGASSGSNVTSFQPGSATPSEDNELVITGITVDGAGLDSPSINGGFAITDSLPGVGGVRVAGGQAYLIQTSAAAANPTWSWTTSQAPAAAIATYKVASAPAGNTVEPGLGELTVTGYAPTLTINTIVRPDVGALSVTGFAPTLTLNTIVRPDVGTLSATGFAPTVTASDNKTVTPDVGSLTATGFAPTLTQSDNKIVSPALGQLTLAGFAPTVSVSSNQTVAPDVGSLTATGFALTLSVSDHKTVAPDVGSVTVNGFAPTVTATANQFIAPALGQVTVTGYEPLITSGDARIVQAGSGTVTLTGFAPTVSSTANQFVSPDAGTLSVSGFAPTLSVSDQQQVSPATGQVSVTGFAPTVTRTANQYLEPGTGELTITGYAPTVTASDAGTLIPQTGSLVITGYEPTIHVLSPEELVTGELTGSSILRGELTGGSVLTGELTGGSVLVGELTGGSF